MPVVSVVSSRFAIVPACAVMDRRLSPRDLTVLCALGLHTDRQGWCYPSLSSLGTILGVTRQAIQRSIRTLGQAGYLQVQSRFHDGAQTSNMIRVLFDYTPATSASREGVHVAGGATSEVAGGATSEVARTSHSNVLSKTLPESFTLQGGRRAYAEARGVQDVETEWEAFIAHHQAHGKKMKDWDAAWRTWVLNVRKFGGMRYENTRGLSAADRVRQATGAVTAHSAASGNFPHGRTVAPDDDDVRA